MITNEMKTSVKETNVQEEPCQKMNSLFTGEKKKRVKYNSIYGTTATNPTADEKKLL